MRRICLALACLGAVALAVGPAPAVASSNQESIMQDDGLLLFSGADTRNATLDEMRSLGTQTVRVFVYWNLVAPESTSTKVPPGFDGADPSRYASGLWDRYDSLVRATLARGMSIILTPTTPAPAWASKCRGSVATRQTCRPDAAQYGAFVRALGTRYSGSYSDDNDGGGTLPRVIRWGLLNEPNVGRWLTPQFVRSRGRLVPASPAIYRAMAESAISSLRATGHGADQILLGETAPIGNTTGPIVRRPVATATFWRDLLCIDRSGRNLRGRAAREQGCTTPPKLLATAIAHHPYIRGGSRAPLTRPRADEITIANPSRLLSILAQGAARGRLGRRLPLYYTEFGFQTNPPDRSLGVRLSRQASYLSQSDYLAYRDSNVRGLAQYLLRDDRELSGFQSGLEFSDGRHKPGYDAYRFPVWVVRRGVSVRVFGQVRQATDPPAGRVRIQLKLPKKAWTTFKTVRPNVRGFINTRFWSKHGSWRLVWVAPSGATITSRTAEESRR